MEDIDKKILMEHAQALNRVADSLEGFLDGLPGFLNQLERNEALLIAKHERVKTRSAIAADIDKYERKIKREANENQKKKDEKRGF